MGKPVQQYMANAFFFILLLLVLGMGYGMIKPYLDPLILSLVFAVIFFPIHKKIENRLGNRKNLAASVSCLGLTLLVILPLFFLTFALITQGITSFNKISVWIAGGGLARLTESPHLAGALSLLKKYFPNFNASPTGFEPLVSASSTIGKMLLNQGSQLFGNIAGLAAKFFLMLFAFYFMVMDGEAILDHLSHLSPLTRTQEKEILSSIKTVARSALLGTAASAAAQGAAGGIAFAISGLPGLFWGMVMAFCSLVPVVGTTLIWIPAALYLFITGKWGYGIFMILWCVIVVGMMDNFIRPLFMKGSSGMSTPVIFFAILGGMSYFGILGILYGPMVFGAVAVLLKIYNDEFEDFLKDQDGV